MPIGNDLVNVPDPEDNVQQQAVPRPMDSWSMIPSEHKHPEWDRVLIRSEEGMPELQKKLHNWINSAADAAFNTMYKYYGYHWPDHQHWKRVSRTVKNFLLVRADDYWNRINQGRFGPQHFNEATQKRITNRIEKYIEAARKTMADYQRPRVIREREEEYLGWRHRKNLKRLREHVEHSKLHDFSTPDRKRRQVIPWAPRKIRPFRLVSDIERILAGSATQKYRARMAYVTQQRDFRGSRGSRRRSYKRGRIMRFRKRRRFLIKRRRYKRFGRRVRKIVNRKFRLSHFWSWSRSWISEDDKQGVAYIPFLGFVGDSHGNATDTVPFKGQVVGITGTNGLYTGPMNFMRWFITAVRDAQWTFKSASSNINAPLADWWLKPGKTFMDLTISNQGNGDDYTEAGEPAEPTSFGSTRNIEYDVFMLKYRGGTDITSDSAVIPEQNWYKCWQNGINDDYFPGITQYNAVHIQDDNLPDEVFWTPTQDKRLKKFFKVKKLGSGYLRVGEQLRILKSFRPRRIFTARWFNRKFDDAKWEDYPTTLYYNGFISKFSAGIMIIWKGASTPGEIPTTSNGEDHDAYRSRLDFSVQMHCKISTNSNDNHSYFRHTKFDETKTHGD